MKKKVNDIFHTGGGQKKFKSGSNYQVSDITDKLRIRYPQGLLRGFLAPAGKIGSPDLTLLAGDVRVGS